MIQNFYRATLLAGTLALSAATATLAGCATTQYARRNDAQLCRYTPNNTASYHPSCAGSCHAKLAGVPMTSTLEQFLTKK